MARRKRPERIKVTLGRHAVLGGGHLAPLPFLKIKLGKSKLVGFPTRVRLKNNFGEQFKARDKVLRLHVTGNGARTLVNLFRELQALEPKIMELGFKGLYADTPNKAIVKALARHGWTTMPTPQFLDGFIRLIVEEHRGVIMHSTRVIKRFETD